MCTLRQDEMSKGPQVGAFAPDFELEGTAGTFRLSDHRGERVVLLFYPGDFTPVCTKQFCSYAARAEDVDGLGAVVVGISGQDLDSHESFVAKHGLNVPLLADPDNAVASLYGAHARFIGTRRSVVIVDERGIVRHRHDHTLGLDFQDVDELEAALASF
jgi:peroxiredoxin Q/BCP